MRQYCRVFSPGADQQLKLPFIWLSLKSVIIQAPPPEISGRKSDCRSGLLYITGALKAGLNGVNLILPDST